MLSVELDEWQVPDSEYLTWDIKVFGYGVGQQVIEKTEEGALEAAKVRFAGAIEAVMNAERQINNMWLNSED